MLERGDFRDGFTIHEYSVQACSARINELWVPTEFHKDIFKNMMNAFGFPAPRIAIIPEAVDTSLFDPAVYETETDSCSCNKEKNLTLECPYRLGQPFTFISIFKWEMRKGWDILLRAYWDAFSVSEHVLLKLRYMDL